MEWTPEEIAALRELWPFLSAPKIALKFGCSKNSILGKAHRLGLPKKGQTPPRKGCGTDRRSHRAKPKLIPDPLPSFAAKEPALRLPEPVRSILAPALRTRFADGSGCRYIAGKYSVERLLRGNLFCDADLAPDCSYCRKHKRICYQKMHTTAVSTWHPSQNGLNEDERISPRKTITNPGRFRL